jgi:hypothetical protein
MSHFTKLASSQVYNFIAYYVKEYFKRPFQGTASFRQILYLFIYYFIMAKKSLIQRELKRQKCVAQYAEKRKALKQAIKDTSQTSTITTKRIGCSFTQPL